MPAERRGQVIAVEIGSTGNGRSLTLNGRRQPSCGGTSRMTRECQVRICEGLEVKFLGPTRRKSDSATTSRAPPGPRSFVRVTSRWIARRSRSRMSWKLSCRPICTRLHHSCDSCKICQFATHSRAISILTLSTLRSHEAMGVLRAQELMMQVSYPLSAGNRHIQIF